MVVLPSSPVWYQSRGIDTSHNGILAFASRNLVFLLDLAKKRPEIYGILSGHTDKVTSCSFCPAISQNQLLRLVSGADDSTVKVWDACQKLLISEHSSHGASKIVSVHWSPVNPSLIFSGDEKGFVICWNVDKDTTDRFYPDGTSQMQLCCLTCSPFQENLVAVGYKSGAVSVMDVGQNGAVIKKLRGHTNEVHAVVWSPFQDEEAVFGGDVETANGTSEPGEEQRKAFGVIASGSKDKTIKLWNVDKGKCIKTLRIPSRPSKGRRVNEDVARLYVTLYWPRDSSTKFISSGYNGDVILWDIGTDAENSYEILACQTHDAGHHRIVFNISSGVNPNSIITTSMDRQILHWTVPVEAASSCSGPDWTLPTLGGFVYAIAISPKDPSVVAIGVGDGMIRIWRTGSPRSAYDITTLWQGIKEKVMALSWHPTKEGSLAYATEDGKVGIYDTLSQRPPIIAETYHLKPVYALSWGPHCFVKTTADSEPPNMKTPCLFSCGGDGVILQHNPAKFSDDAVNIDNIIAATNVVHTPGRHSEVSWSHNGHLVAIGNDNGVINIFTAPHLLHILEIKSHPKIVNCVRWRPAEDVAEGMPSQIASGSNSSVIYIHDLAKIFSENSYEIGDEIDKPMLVSKQGRSLVGHVARITGLSYNPRNPSEIVSSSYDGTAQVWDVETENPISNFRGHHGRLMCVAWGSVTTDPTTQASKTSGLLFSGADDYTIHGWYAEDQQHTEPVKCIPDFGFGMKNKFQGKKKTRNKKSQQGGARPKAQAGGDGPQGVNRNITTNIPSTDLDVLLEKKRLELLASVGSEQEAQSKVTENGHGLANREANNIFTSNSSLPKNEQGPLPANKAAFFMNNAFTYKQRSSPSSKADASSNWRSNATEEDFSVKKRKRVKNMFPQSVSLDNRKKSDQHQDCLKIVKWKTRDELSDDRPDLSFLPGSGDHINLGFYTDRRSAFRMMKNEAKQMEDDDVIEGSCNLKIWMGDVVGAIEGAIEKSQLTDHLVSMAPMAGHAFWRKTARAFAKQLVNEDHHLHAVHYLLACGDLHEAIQLLLDNRHYREAVALARARLSDSDPILKKTVKMWAYKLKNGGSVEIAAKCFASIGEFREAATCLAQRASSGASTATDSDVASLWAAASVAQYAGELDLVSEFATRAVNSVCLRTWNWVETGMILSTFDNLQCYSLILVAHEILATRLVDEGGMSGPSTTNKSPWNADRLHSLDEKETKSFPEVLIQVWKHVQSRPVPENPSSDTELQQQIHTLAMEPVPDHMTTLKAIYQVALRVSASVVTSLRVHQLQSETTNGEDSDTAMQNTPSEGKDWIAHLINALKIVRSIRDASADVMRKTFLRVICEVTWWANRGFRSQHILHNSENGEARTDSAQNLVSSLKALCLNEIQAQPDRTGVNGLALPEACSHGKGCCAAESLKFLLTEVQRSDDDGDLCAFLARNLCVDVL